MSETKKAGLDDPRFTTLIDDEFWEDLLDSIKEDKVIPIVGKGVTTVAPSDELISPWLAPRLARNLGLPAGKMAASQSVDPLNRIVCEYLLRGGDHDAIYTRLHRILERDNPKPGKTLNDLASIEHFKLFISTTFDPLLWKALNSARHIGDPPPRVCAYSPDADSKDLPASRKQLPARTIYHILGKSSPAGKGDFVVWEDDMLEFILKLDQHMVQDLPNLKFELKDQKLHFLLLGLNFSDWLVRFFLRATWQDRLKGSAWPMDYIFEESSVPSIKGLVMFLNSVGKKVRYIPCDPRKFVQELAARWHRKFPKGVERIKPEKLPKGPVFISYAREDEKAARNLNDGLKKRGIDVLFDKQRLKNGMNYHRTLQVDVEHRCEIFVSVVSKTTESKSRAYFHRERNWAALRAESYADFDRGEFYHPVIIDDLEMNDIQREPWAFESSQKVRLPGGLVTDDFANRILEILRKRTGSSKP